MKITRTKILFDGENVVGSAWFRQILDEISEAVLAIRWPEHSKEFTIHPQKKGNGVVPIKEAFTLKLKTEFGWQLEKRLAVSKQIRPGPIDAVRMINEKGKFFAMEWETGNISSSHRALNKMTLGILEGKLAGGILLVPSRALYVYLTDRIGNYRELEPYFPVYSAVNTRGKGILAVIEVEHDDVSCDVPLIKKGTDGRALI